MPIYEYKCENEHVFEVMQKISAGPVEACEICGAPVQRVFHPIAVHFKGKGFYNTDYGKKSRGAIKVDGSSSDGAASDGAGKESKKSEKSEKSEKSDKPKPDKPKSDSKPAASSSKAD